MLVLSEITRSFPSARLPSAAGGLPVEVVLVAQLGHGVGDQLFEGVSSRQRAHAQFVDALEEPSARLAATDFAKGDPTALYSFVVGPGGHPFHRHAGHRIFTAVSGSGGAQLRFSSASSAQMQDDPDAFVRALRYINVPADCLFTVRFGGETWHQFAPLRSDASHPAFFALSCHTNELGGALSEAMRAQVLADAATIPALTDVLPDVVADLLRGPRFDHARVPTVALSLDAVPGSVHGAVCTGVRGTAGVIRGALTRWRGAKGFLSNNGGGRQVVPLEAPPAGSLLLRQFVGQRVHHDDTFALTVERGDVPRIGAAELLARLLDGFLENAPAGVSRMMALRNVLVRPLGLRTSPLGCPVSSLLSAQRESVFAGRFPVLDQAVDPLDTRAQVILGADDKHLAFRSCVGVEFLPERRVRFTLGTRVRCTNLFGRFYMGVIDRVHRGYITPAMLRMAVDHAIGTLPEPVALSETPRFDAR